MKYTLPEPTVWNFEGYVGWWPEPDVDGTARAVNMYTAAQVQAAFDAGRAAGLEAAAKVCDTDWNGDSDSYEWANSCNECADAIRNLAKEPPCAS